MKIIEISKTLFCVFYHMVGIVLQCQRLVVLNATYAACNGVYEYFEEGINQTESWRPVFKHLNKENWSERYIFWSYDNVWGMGTADGPLLSGRFYNSK